MTNSVQTLLLSLLIVIGGCATLPPADLQTRQIQTRAYNTLDKQMTMRSVIATLQDLGFTIDQADLALGVVTATRLHEYTMRMTVTIVEKGEDRISVRVNARIGEDSIRNAATYQDFFVVLNKAMFLTLNKVD